MSEFPTSDEEFELTYGDELEILKEHEEFFESTSSNKENSSNINNSLIVESQKNPVNTQLVTQSRKRTIEELFGDIDDLLLESTAKKYKEDGTLDRDQNIIQKILELREKNQSEQSLTLPNRELYKSREEDSISYSLPNFPHISVKTKDNQPYYIRYHSEEFMKEDVKRTISNCNLKETVVGGFESVWDEAQALINLQLDNEKTQNTQQETKLNACVDQAKQLWVDLYKPKSYLQLLSDEGTNRMLLKWIKLWDKVVFNRKPKIKPKPINNNEKNKWKSFGPVLNTDLDENGRPHNKVVLLCGPPGLGKTTLAYMVAKQAGYNVVEVNASDDRNTETFKNLLENATQMRSVIDSENRPNCLIFDEIDGASNASIDYLVKFVNGTNTTKSKKNNKKPMLLKRPIICICNDLYTPSLRSLRQIAFVVNFPPTCSTRLAQRLLEISKQQKIKTDLGAMIALAEKSYNDIRSCLAFLHFFKYENKPVTLSHIMRANVGEKDVQKGLFTIWQSIFSLERSVKSRMNNILNTIHAFGDYQRVALGVYENYPTATTKNHELNGISQALEWFCFTDLINKYIYSEQNYSLMVYLPYAFVVWHLIFAGNTKPTLRYPNADFEAKNRKLRQTTIVSTVLNGIQPQIRVYNQRTSLILDTLPLLSRILTPVFRPVSLHFYTKDEKEILLRVVNIMIDYNLNYVQERNIDGTYKYCLEPNIYDLIQYEKLNTQFKQLSYSNKQLIAQEIDKEKMKRFEIGKKQMKPAVPNHLQQLKVKTVKPVIQNNVSKDFFGRPIIKQSPQKESNVNNSPKNDIIYVYKDGHNHAVRKYVKIKNLK